MPVLQIGRKKPASRPRAYFGRKAITASAERAQDSKGALLRLDQRWQREAMRIYRTVGECWNPAQYYSRAMERIRYYPAIRDEKGVPVEVKDGPLVDLFKRITSPSGAPGDLSEIAGSYARLQFVIGDGMLTVSEDDGGEVWEYLSPMELRMQPRDGTRPQEYRRHRAPGTTPDELTEAPDSEFRPLSGERVHVWRLWRRHPEYCVDEDTEIFTRDGWRKHGDLHPGMAVLTLDHETGESEWQPVSAVNRFEAREREMVSIEGRMHSSLTTLDHRWPTIHYGRAPVRTAREWTTSEHLNSNDRIITAAPCSALPREETFADAFVEAVAWFWTEGSISKRYRSAQVTISQSREANPHQVGRIRSSMQTMFGSATTERMSTGSGTLAPPKWREHVKADGATVEFWLNTAASAELLEVAPNKIVSLDFVRALTREQLELFVETSLDADGWRVTETAARIYQKDSARLMPLEYAAILLGRTTRLRGQILTITDRSLVHLQCEAKAKLGRLNQPRRIAHTGIIWCPTTKNGTWLARRNGLTFYTGNSQWSDSPVRPVIELYELLNRLTLAVGAEATSRAAQRGLLFIPDEFSYGPVDTTQEENPDEDPIIKELTDSMSRAISNPGTAEAAQPFVFRAPGITNIGGAAIPTKDLIAWIALSSGDRYVEGEMWDKTISRIAGSIDMPKELMTGVGDVSHWGQWFLDDIGFRQHTGPTVIRFCNDMAAAYLRPAAIEEGIDDAEQVTVWFDASQAINHPDETGVARDAHDRLVVSDDFYRSKIGASDTDAPPPEELKRRTEIKLKEDPYTVGQSVSPQGQTSPQEGGRGGDVEQVPPTDSQHRPPGTKPPSPAGPNLAAMIVGAAEMQIIRARELAGNRLWRRAQSCDECRDTAKNVPPALIAAALGPETVRSVIEGHATEASLVDGVGIAFADLVRELGIDKGWPEQLGRMVEQHALRTLYEREVPRVPSGFWSAAQKASGEAE